VILSYEHLDSTNRVARELVLDGCASGTVVQAASQSSGRGQHGRVFSSPVGGLYFTLVLVPDLPLSGLPLATLATGLACRETILAMTGLRPWIKWPNDLYLEHRKVAGILCESVILPGEGQPARVLVGVGVNVNSRVNDFPREVRPIVTTLREHVSEPLDLQELLPRFVQSISSRVAMLRDTRAAVLAEWQQYDYLVGKNIVCTTGSSVREGVAAGLGADGRYCLRDAEGAVHEVIGGQLRLRSAWVRENKSDSHHV
jgi:BirA family biotin operon repressor/biotin-[acetyl-CoA-carboxylase] ligase